MEGGTMIWSLLFLLIAAALGYWIAGKTVAA
jgi:hypothetical protein